MSEKGANFTCEYYGVSEQNTGGALTIDHFRPQSKSGGDELGNLVYCCVRCNLYKSDFCRNSHWIVLLDRTEPNFFSAVEQLNTDFSQRESDLLPDEFPALPNGLEAMFFTEKIR